VPFWFNLLEFQRNFFQYNRKWDCLGIFSERKINWKILNPRDTQKENPRLPAWKSSNYQRWLVSPVRYCRVDARSVTRRRPTTRFLLSTCSFRLSIMTVLSFPLDFTRRLLAQITGCTRSRGRNPSLLNLDRPIQYCRVTNTTQGTLVATLHVNGEEDAR